MCSCVAVSLAVGAELPEQLPPGWLCRSVLNKACAVGVATSACTAAEVNSVGEEEGEESNNKVVFFVCWGKVANDGETFDRDEDDDANEVSDEEGEEGSSVDSGDDMNIVEIEEAADEDIEGETLGT